MFNGEPLSNSLKYRGSMLKVRYIFVVLVFVMSSRCATIDPTLTVTTIEPIKLLISSEDMPVGWKSYEAFSDGYDDLCYIDCAMIQFYLIEEGKASSEQSIYVYNTVAEAERNYENQLIPLQLGTKPNEWSYQSEVAFQSNFACYHHTGAPFPSCTWIAQYEKYLVFFVAPLIPDRMSLSDLEKVTNRIDSNMEVVVNQNQ